MTDDGDTVFDVVIGCGSQVRTFGLGGILGLDFGAIMTVGTARGANAELLAEVLPSAERAIVAALSNEPTDGGADG